MSDTIDRQAAIDAINSYFGFNIEEEYGSAVQEVINSLPPTQPEIIRCKDCKHHWIYKSMDRMPIERCDLEQTFYDAEYDFCSLAERREDG